MMLFGKNTRYNFIDKNIINENQRTHIFTINDENEKYYYQGKIKKATNSATGLSGTPQACLGRPSLGSPALATGLSVQTPTGLSAWKAKGTSPALEIIFNLIYDLN